MTDGQTEASEHIETSSRVNALLTIIEALEPLESRDRIKCVRAALVWFGDDKQEVKDGKTTCWVVGPTVTQRGVTD